MTDKLKQAFPSNHDLGMTLREYYAGQAMQGLIAEGSIYSVITEEPDASLIAKRALKLADALITEIRR